MADITFGVKVSEEMKNELSELMKNTQLSGKEFMSLLLSSYKLEQEKKEERLSSDFKELQELLSRIQNLYLNVGEKTDLYLKNQVNHHNLILEQKENEKKVLAEKIDQLEEKNNQLSEAIKKLSDQESQYNKKVGQYEKEIESLKKLLEDQKNQLKNNQLLYRKFEEETLSLKDTIERYKRLDIEIEERNNENTKLKNRNDELASQIWFLNREVEKNTEEKENLQKKYENDFEQLKKNYELQLKNSLLEEKLLFNKQMDALKEEQFQRQKSYAEKMNKYLDKNLGL